MSRTLSGAVRRTRDDLGDLVKDIEDVQLAARQDARRAVIKVVNAAKAMTRPAAAKTPAKAPVKAAAKPPAAKAKAAKKK